MRMPSLLVVAVLATLQSGCYASFSSQSQSGVSASAGAAHVGLSSGSPLGAALIVGILMADGMRYYRVGPDGSRSWIGVAPEPDPHRRINVQDCTLPISPDAGNLMCK
jgi:hypothetical protein